MTTIPLHPVTTETPVEVICRVCTQAVPAVGADSAALFLRLGNLLLQLRGAGVDELELRELGVEDADDLCELCGVSNFVVEVNGDRQQGVGTYRIVGLAGLAEGLGCAVDFLDHLCEVLVQLVEAVLEFLGELVSISLC